MDFFPMIVFKSFVFSILIFSTFSHATTIQVAVFQDHFDAINSFAKDQACPSQIPIQYEDNQMVAEYLILCNALAASGQNFRMSLVSVPVAERALQAIEQRKAHVTGFGLWQQQISKFDAKASLRLLDNNEFTKGLFTSQEKSKTLDFFKLKNRHDYIVALNKNWQHDWSELNCSGLTLKHIDQYEQMFKLVELGRVDLVPLTFNSKHDMQRTAFGIPLYPIKGIKFTINDSLHFAVNDKTPAGKALSKALDIGLQKLNQQTFISSVYNQLGVTNLEIQHWQDVGCQCTSYTQK
ncbi:hypothetical protein theurythT_28230 [Thalassotalea eurytherma]|uniref:Solute-binding protein family 3/N-terminal domain-containing protein n=2 Tax=Thalassotalea eurytherma TaxID=1144278 RepID=A0ABQ6H5D8_9GAMM|nr:hypothetical protein theurythT_28230 [Thalassotalea eurytherma]